MRCILFHSHTDYDFISGYSMYSIVILCTSYVCVWLFGVPLVKTTKTKHLELILKSVWSYLCTQCHAFQRERKREQCEIHAFRILILLVYDITISWLKYITCYAVVLSIWVLYDIWMWWSDWQMFISILQPDFVLIVIFQISQILLFGIGPLKLEMVKRFAFTCLLSMTLQWMN
jgi:hypothetical protein